MTDTAIDEKHLLDVRAAIKARVFAAEFRAQCEARHPFSRPEQLTISRERMRVLSLVESIAPPDLYRRLLADLDDVRTNAQLELPTATDEDALAVLVHYCWCRIASEPAPDADRKPTLGTRRRSI